MPVELRTGTVNVLDPVGPVRRLDYPLAPRPASLAGARIGVLDNSKPNADALIGGAVDHLEAHEGARLARRFTKPGPASAAPSDWYATLRDECDVVLTGSADCGSCTSWSVYDAIELEKAGVPVVVLGTDAFQLLAESERETLGMPELALAIVPYPIGGVDPAGTREKGRSAGPRVADLLLGRLSGTAT